MCWTGTHQPRTLRRGAQTAFRLAGTGSGSFSHSLVRTIAPTGRLHTFEYHATRAQVAKDEFIAHGLGELVVIQHRDVCADGFGLDDVADAGLAP